MPWNRNIHSAVLSHTVLVCDTFHMVYLLCVKCSTDVKELPFCGCGRVSHAFVRVSRFSYSGTADVRELI